MASVDPRKTQSEISTNGEMKEPPRVVQRMFAEISIEWQGYSPLFPLSECPIYINR